jgi:MtaA/CmuA family methyltransferase
VTSKERCLAVISGEPTDRVPVFPLLMFFALQRAGFTYREFASNGRAMAEAQLNVRERFGIDAITACSDAFRIAADLGGDIVFPEDNPPFLTTPLVTSSSDIDRLPRPDAAAAGGRMADRALGVRDMVAAAGDDCLVLGWVDMPFAEACSLCGVAEFMLLLYDQPLLAHRLLDALTDIVVDFALLQLEAGAPMIGAGDAAASLIGPELYREFALPYESRACAAVHDAGGLVKLHICGNTTASLRDMARAGADLYSVDHLVPLTSARDVFGEAGLCYKGNLDPVADMLQATPEHCLERALACIHLAEGTPYMVSPGCEVPGETPDAVFEALCEAPIRASS